MSPNRQLPSARGTIMHKNAPLTPKGREVLVQHLQADQSVAKVAQAMGLPETTVRKWWRRHQPGEGLQDRSSRPHHSPRAIVTERRAQIEALRRQRRTGRLIAQELGVSSATVSRVLRRAGLRRWRSGSRPMRWRRGSALLASREARFFAASVARPSGGAFPCRGRADRATTRCAPAGRATLRATAYASA